MTFHKLAALAALVICLPGCGGKGITTDISLVANLTAQDPQTPAGAYYDTWTFIPDTTANYVFAMHTGNFPSRLLLKNSAGQVLFSGQAPGEDPEEGTVDDNCHMGGHLVAGELYTVIASSITSHQIGNYRLLWSEGLQLVSAGT